MQKRIYLVVLTGLLLLFMFSCKDVKKSAAYTDSSGESSGGGDSGDGGGTAEHSCGNRKAAFFEVDSDSNAYTPEEISYKMIEYGLNENEDDPLIYYQWHLSSRGQKFVNNTVLSFDGDINVEAAHNKYMARGLGVVINVIDTSLEMRHIDLSTNFKYSYNFFDSTNDPSPSLFISDTLNCDDHGTKVAGLIGAKNSNSEGGVGVAPSATLIGHNLLAKYSFENFKTSMGVPDDSQKNSATYADVMNLSFGFDSINYAGPVNYSFTEVLKKGVFKGRKAKGYVYVKSAGNGYRFSQNADACKNAILVDVSCKNVSNDFHFVEPYSIKVSALNFESKLTSYSTTGAGIFVAAPGGEYSIDPTTRLIDSSDNSDTSYYYEPAMLTTDLMGCALGSSLDDDSLSYNDFEFDHSQQTPSPSPLNPDCHYTSVFNGTSAAAPVVSGVVALMLGQNPNLSWRQVKYILATSADKNDPECKNRYVEFDQAGQTYRPTSNKKSGYMIDQCWFTNKASFNFSNRYGFGKVNASSAVEFAGLISQDHYSAKELKTYGEISNDLYLTGQPMDITNPQIPKLYDVKANNYNESSTNYLASFEYGESQISKLDAVMVIVKISTKSPDKILLRLKSPMGTSNIILSPFTDLTGSNDFFYSGYLSNAFFGEGPRGVWEFEAYDLSYEDAATLNHVGLVMYGS